MSFSLYNLYNELKTKNILLCYSGPVAQVSIEGVGETLRRNMDLEKIKNTTKIAVFSTFIEQIQNVLHYSAEKISGDGENAEELRIGVNVIGYDDSGNYIIYCGNKVYNKDIQGIKDSIDPLIGLNKEELKQLYKERRRNNNANPHSKGAGLGIIEMARRSAMPISYSFEEISEELSFFSIKVVVGRE